MQNSKQSYKKFNKANRKKKVMTESDVGEISRSNGGNRNPIVSLPEIVTNHVIQEYRRFVNNGSLVSANLTIADCLKQFTVATSSTNLICYAKAVRIKKIRVLSPVTTQGTSVVLSLQPTAVDTGTNNFNSIPEKYVDTSASIDIPAYLSLTPSIDTPLGSWHYATTVDSNLVAFVAPAGSTLDILFEYILNIDTTISAYSRTVAGATIGIFYTGNIMTNFVPQSRAVI